MTITCWYYTYGFVMPWKDFLAANKIFTKRQEEAFEESKKEESCNFWSLGLKFKVKGRTFIVRQPTHDQKLEGNDGESVVIGLQMLTVDRETMKCTMPANRPSEEERDEVMQLLVDDSIYSAWLNEVSWRKDFKVHQTTDDCECCS